MSWAGKVRSAKQVLPAGQQFVRCCLPGSSLVGPGCQAGLRGLPRPFDVDCSKSRRNWQQTPIALGLGACCHTSSVRLRRTSIPAEWTYFGSSLVGPACRAGLRGLPRPFDVIRSKRRLKFLKPPGGGCACRCACVFGFAERPFRQNGRTSGGMDVLNRVNRFFFGGLW